MKELLKRGGRSGGSGEAMAAAATTLMYALFADSLQSPLLKHPCSRSFSFTCARGIYQNAGSATSHDTPCHGNERRHTWRSPALVFPPRSGDDRDSVLSIGASSPRIFASRLSALLSSRFRDSGFKRKALGNGWDLDRVMSYLRISQTYAFQCSSRGVSTGVSSLAFAEPSVTSGEVEEYREQLTDREVVLNFLHSQGIDISELEGVELPKDLEVVKDRVEFLKKIGLTIGDIDAYPLMVGCSVKKNLIPVLGYLESLKITRKSVPFLIRKYPQILQTSVVIDLIPVVRYLQGLGIEAKQIGSVLSRYPEVLGFRIEGTTSTSIAYLVMIGVNTREIGPILTEKPDILGMRVGNNIKPKVDYLTSLGIPRPIVAKMIENRPFILGFDLADQMRPAVENLLEVGVRKEAIAHVLVQFPDILGLEVKERVAKKLPWLTAKVGVSKDRMGQILEKLPQILVMNVPFGTARVNALRDAGFSAKLVGQMVADCPQLLALSVDKTLKPNLEFLVKEMKRNLKEVVDFPEYLTYSLEGRIRPRHELIRDNHIQCSLAWMLNCSDAKFEERLKVDSSGKCNDNEERVPFVVAGRVQVKEEDHHESKESPDDEDMDANRRRWS